MRLVLVAILGLLLGPAALAQEPAFSTADLTPPPRESWLTNGGNLSNHRYSPLTQINTANVGQLRAAWRTHLDGSGLGPQYSGEAQPLVHKGVIYVVTGADDVFAVSVKTGAILWKYQAHLAEITTVCCGWTSRGVAMGEGKIFVGQLDGKLVALDARTGKIVWSVQSEKWQEGYTITGAPLYYNGLFIVGAGGSEKAIRGRLRAFNAKTGKPAWVFHTIPAPGEPGAETWPKGSDVWKVGGGAIWMTPAIDPALGLIYFGTSNPGGDFNGSIREGDNLYNNSVIALDVKTGKYRWHYQTVHHDIWDYSLANPPIIYDPTINGMPRKAIALAGKTGFVYILDRVTGQPLLGIEERAVPQEPRQKTAATQPYPVGDAFVPQEIDIAPEGYALVNKGRIFTPFWTDPLPIKPAPIGGTGWPPSSFDPDTNRMFICSADKLQVFAGGDRDNGPWVSGQNFTGGAFTQLGFPTFGIFTAMDLTTNRIVWQQRWKEICYSGSAVTAGGLVFVGRGDGRMTALDASDGKLLWEFQTGAGVNAPPSVFEYEGKQYVVVLSAGNLFARSPKGDSLWLFALDGKMEPVAPPGTQAAVPAAPPPEGHTGAAIDARKVFLTACGGCHGPAGEGTGNGIPLGASKDAAKNAAIIRNGKGDMPPFAQVLADAEIAQLAAYVATLKAPVPAR